MKSQEFVAARVNKGQIGLRDAEQEILQFVNWSAI